MKRLMAAGFAATLALGAILAAAEMPWSDSQIVSLLASKEKLVQVNAKRIEISPEVKFLCMAPDTGRFKSHLRLSTSYSPFADVLVTSEGVAAMKEPAGKFPLGTVILKRKFPSKTSLVPELYTGMLKREAGYNPDCGDWEFFVVAGNGKTITARGKIDSCMGCHQEYAKTDYVTKAYR